MVFIQNSLHLTWLLVELKIKDESENPPTHDPVHYLYNPFLFAYATLLDPETEEEIPYSDDSLHILTGSIASCVYHLKDPENSNQFAAFFVFPEIAIRQEGQFRLKISLFKISGFVLYLFELILYVLVIRMIQ